MTTVVIMPGGFHPFHAGHAALYQSARRAFPDAEVFVAATNDTSARPFPFAVKEKLARLAGVEPGHFMQVKSPFKAEEITQNFNPDQDVVIFIRSEKDAGKPPMPGGTKKDGTPGYLQPLIGAKKLEPFVQHAYMAYLPTVEFGPGMTSATEIRTAWPALNEKRKTALVMSLYPKTQTNPKLAANVVKMLDTAMGSETQGVAESTADDVTKLFTNVYDPAYANLQRVALLAMQGRQSEAAGRLQTVIKDADPAVQKKITDAVNSIKPVTINGRVADSSTLDKSKQHNDWIINTFIPWVQSLLSQPGVAEGSDFFAGSKFADEEGNTFSVEKIIAFAKKNPKYFHKDFPLSKIKHDLSWWQGNKERMMNADTSFPLLVIQNDDGHLGVADGLNRMKKAVDVEKRTTIDVYLVPKKDIMKFSEKQGVAENADYLDEHR